MSTESQRPMLGTAFRTKGTACAKLHAGRPAFKELCNVRMGGLARRWSSQSFSVFHSWSFILRIQVGLGSPRAVKPSQLLESALM